MLEAVIFDFDGIIADTPKHYFRHMKHVLHRHNTTISDEEISQLVGLRLEEKLRHINQKYGLGILVDEFISNTQDLAKEEMYSLLEFDKNLESLLRSLQEDKVKMAIASNNSAIVVNRVLKSFGISHYFGAVVCGEDVKNCKPFPDVYLRAISLLGVSPKKSIGIEDTTIGVAAAKSAGLWVVAMPNEYVAKHDFGSADLVVGDFKDLSITKLKGLVK